MNPAWAWDVTFLVTATNVSVVAYFIGCARIARTGQLDSEALLAEERTRTKDLQNRLDARSLTEYAVADEYVSHERPAERSDPSIPPGARFVSDETGLVDGYVLDDDADG